MSGLHWTQVVAWTLLFALVLVPVLMMVIFGVRDFVRREGVAVLIKLLLGFACGALVIAAAVGVFAP